MKLLLGGVRGTSTVAQRSFMKYGGDTTSFLIESADKNAVLVDVGTGIRVCADYIQNNMDGRSLLLLMTHYHFDHVAGFPSFSVVYNPEWSLTIAAPVRDGFSCREVVSSLLARPFWPLQIQALQANITFKNFDSELAKRPLKHNDLEIRWCPVHHGGGCSAYRFDEPSSGKSVVIATDAEWQASNEEEKELFLKFCREPSPATCLIFDGHFRPEIYPRFKGWGHSTWKDAQEITEAVDVERLVITHHDPWSNDSSLEELEAELQDAMSNAVLARQGKVLDL